MDATTERAINELAARQGGHLLRRQILEAGAAKGWIDRRRTSGLLVPVGARTMRLASVAPTPRGDVIAACLDHGAVASHWSAAWLHGLACKRPGVDVTVNRRSTLRPRRAEITRGHHTPEQLVADSRRFNELQLLGNRVLQFRFDQVVHAHDSMISTMRRALADRSLAA